MPERFAQEALGHASRAVHRVYARNGHVIVPAHDELESAAAEGKWLPPFVSE
jgi:hypothetical protein